MRLIVQRVSKASVEIGGKVFSSIGNGVMCLCGIRDDDTEKVMKISLFINPFLYLLLILL